MPVTIIRDYDPIGRLLDQAAPAAMLAPAPVSIEIRRVKQSDVRGVAAQAHYCGCSPLLVPKVVLDELRHSLSPSRKITVLQSLTVTLLFSDIVDVRIWVPGKPVIPVRVVLVIWVTFLIAPTLSKLNGNTFERSLSIIAALNVEAQTQSPQNLLDVLPHMG
jgi:hypothetical protein